MYAQQVGLAIDKSIRSQAEESIYSPSILESLIRSAIESYACARSMQDKSLANWLLPGMTVLMKPNWVLHYNKSGKGLGCVITHPKFVLAALRQVVITQPSRIVIGDAPIQSCKWNEILTNTFRQEASRLAKSHSVDLEFVDFRRTVASTGDLSDGIDENLRDDDRYVLFDLASDSLLEPVSSPSECFRVTNYDPRKLAVSHRRGTHQYLICKEAFEANVIVSLPKLKTHGKAGLTGALKNLVGINGHKDFLPHHRVGGSSKGGDCYPGRSLHRTWAEFCFDRANMNIGNICYPFWRRLGLIGWNRIACPKEGRMEGSWYGNDTVWRMVLDLNRILFYGRQDGSMAGEQQRVVLSLTDALVCGQGEGPLAPEPLKMGAVTFSTSTLAADVVHAALLGFDHKRIHLIREAFGDFRWPLNEFTDEPEASLNGALLPLDKVARTVGMQAKPPIGWRGHIERISAS